MSQQAAGCLVGVSVGDALGGPVEGLTASQINKLHGRLTEMMGGGEKALAPGDTSDDTAQTLILAESIVASGGLDPDDVTGRLVDWFRCGAFGIGRQTKDVLARLADGEAWETAASRVQEVNPKSAGNGSLMRCAPIALLRHNDTEILVEDSRLSSRLTHAHDDCQWSCVFVNLVIAHLLVNNDLPVSAVEAALSYCSRREDFPASVLESAKRATSSRKGDQLRPSGYVLDSLECSLWALIFNQTFEETMVAAVNLGGDSDTIGAVTGSMAGAAYGLHSIPARWLACLPHWNELRDLASELISFPDQTKKGFVDIR